MCYGGGLNGAGGIFRVGLDGTYTYIYSFSNESAVGGSPEGGFALHPNGLLYGTTTISSVNLPSEYGALFQFDPASQQVSLVAASGYSPGWQILVGADLALYLVEYAPSGALLARYGTDGSGPQALFNFSSTIDPSPWSTLSSVANGIYVGGFDPYYQVNVSNQILTEISIPAHSASFSPVGNLTETAGGELIGVWPSTSQTPFFGELIEYSGSYPKPPPVILGFYPQTASAGQLVTILGSFFVGTSAVTVAGIPVSYTVKASGAIQFVAPQGPASGVVAVTNGGGLVSSAGNLTVN